MGFAAKRVIAPVVSAFRDNLAELKQCSRDLYVIYALKCMESYGYFCMSLLYTIYLTNEFGMDDFKAGTSYGIWGTSLTAWGVLLAPAIDRLGVRRSLMLSFALSAAARAALATTTRLGSALFLLYGPIGAAAALGVPVMTIGVKRAAPPAARGFAFSLFYAVMNVAALLCGTMIQGFLATYVHGFEVPTLPCNHVLNDGYRLLILSGSLTSAIGFFVSVFGLHGIIDSAEADTPRARPSLSPRTAGGGLAGSMARASATLSRAARSLRDMCTQKELRKFIAVCLLTVNIKQIFRHLDATLPKFQLRAFTDQLGEKGAIRLVGRSYSVNPFLVIMLVPVVGALTGQYEHFDMIHYGSYASALSPLFMVMQQAPWTTYAFVTLLSLGEAIWSPRWYDYSMAVAPHGREGIYTALSAAPLFLAKLPTGMLSGALLMRFCPASPGHSTPSEASSGSAPLCAADAPSPPPDALRSLLTAFVPAEVGTAPGAEAASSGAVRALLDAAWDAANCHGRPMWAIIAALSLTSPLALLLFQRWLRPAPAAESKGYDALKDDGDSGHAPLVRPPLFRDPAPLGVMPLEPPHGAPPFLLGAMAAGLPTTAAGPDHSPYSAAMAPIAAPPKGLEREDSDFDVVEHRPSLDLPAWRGGRRAVLPSPLEEREV